MSTKVTPIHSWPYNATATAYLPPDGTGGVRIARGGGNLSVVVVAAQTIASPGLAERLGAAISQAGEVIRVMNDPATELTALRERVSELEAELAKRPPATA